MHMHVLAYPHAQVLTYTHAHAYGYRVPTMDYMFSCHVSLRLFSLTTVATPPFLELPYLDIFEEYRQVHFVESKKRTVGQSP